jgi:tetratricopeptide (TPR) repeat protein
VKGKTNSTINIPIKNARLWSPDAPYLYDLTATLGKDKVKSYFGMRKIEIKQDEKGIDRIFLNNKYTYNLGTLDQGFWPDGLYTAPTDEALAFDIKASKAMGFNTIRKHIKVEPARWYYHADKLGMLVWQDLVNPGNDTPEGRAEFERENKETIAQLYSYPSIVTWVLFNEKWGQYDQERLTKELKQLDPTRLINGHSGEMLYVNDALRSPSPDAWTGADMTDVHAYPNPGHIKFEKGKAAVLGEFGGIGVPVEGHLWDDLKAGWGYDGVVTPPILRKQYSGMVDSLKKLEAQGLTASIYTQPFDVETEQNGLMTYDRQVIKLPVEVIREIHARLLPVTRNYETATKGFSAIIADTINKAYAARLEEYNKGKRDGAFLRGLALMAKNQKDDLTAVKAATDYINQLGISVSEGEANFIEQFTDKSTDPGFALLINWVSENIKEGLRNKITHKLQSIIFKEKVKIHLGDDPNWSGIEQIITANKPLDGELIRGLSVIYYLNALSQEKPNAVRNLVDAATRYDEFYNSGDYNTWAWELFRKTNDKITLKKAAIWAKKGVDSEKDPLRLASVMDTYANILHKIGRTSEALVWLEKAIAANPGDMEIKENYEKMKRGEKTWPEIKQ